MTFDASKFGKKLDDTMRESMREIQMKETDEKAQKYVLIWLWEIWKNLPKEVLMKTNSGGVLSFSYMF